LRERLKPGVESNDTQVTLEDAGAYITELSKADQDIEEWQAALEALLLVVTLGGPTMFARIGIMRALNRHVERTFDSSRKDHHWGRRKLKRDQ
jgi:cob(I)alamin adenosyltransferase